MTYSKLDSSLIHSTVWREDLPTKVVWITMLAMADRDGVVEASIPGLADASRVPIEQTEAALEKFLSPDKYSRNQEYEGKRIEKVDGGWRLLNYEKHRDKLSPEDIRERARIRQQRKRDREANVTQKCDAGVTKCDKRDLSRMSRHAEAEADAEADQEREREEPSLFSDSEPLKKEGKEKTIPFDLDEAFGEVWEINMRPRGGSRKKALELFELALREIVAKARERKTTPAFDECKPDELRTAAITIFRGYKIACRNWREEKREERHIPYMTTWLNQASWETVEAQATVSHETDEEEEYSGPDVLSTMRAQLKG